MSRRASTPDLRCPRCGYDQRGVVESWRKTCPLRAMCTECGLEFEWAEMLNPDLRRPRWCVESARQWWQVPLASVRTLLMVVRPWRFWREVKMTHGLRPGRLCGFALVVIIMLYAEFALANAVPAARHVQAAGGSTGRMVFSFAYAAALPLSDDPPSAYFVPGAMPTFGARVPESPLEYTSSLLSEGLRPNWLDVRFALLTGRLSAMYWRHPVDVIVLILFAGLPLLTAPLGFLLLPTTLRRARVRARHIVRITVYSMTFLVAVMGWTIARYTLIDPYFSWCATLDVYRDLLLVVHWITPAWLVVWWTFAVGRYLKLPHALGVAVAVTVIGMLIGPALALLVWSVAA